MTTNDRFETDPRTKPTARKPRTYYIFIRCILAPRPYDFCTCLIKRALFVYYCIRSNLLFVTFTRVKQFLTVCQVAFFFYAHKYSVRASHGLFFFCMNLKKLIICSTVAAYTSNGNFFIQTPSLRTINYLSRSRKPISQLALIVSENIRYNHFHIRRAEYITSFTIRIDLFKR